ncbi:hypothetical protein B0H14DRAFT_2625782 [Mycena olivaceomarginata]|nr:hypothetical protein B0H14DRAFT_2625782 [Mycena olivaceomarginata]
MGVRCLTVDIIRCITQGCGFFEAGKEAVSWFTKTTFIPGFSQDAPDWVEINFFPDRGVVTPLQKVYEQSEIHGCNPEPLLTLTLVPVHKLQQRINKIHNPTLEMWSQIRFELNHGCDCSKEHQLVMLEMEEHIVPSTGKQASTSRNCKVLYSVGMGSRGQMWTAGHTQSGSSGGGSHSASWVTTTLFDMLDGGSRDVDGGIGGAVHGGGDGPMALSGAWLSAPTAWTARRGSVVPSGIADVPTGTGNEGGACIDKWWRVDQSWGACAAEMAVESGGSLAHNGTICGQLSTGTLSSQGRHQTIPEHLGVYGGVIMVVAPSCLCFWGKLQTGQVMVLAVLRVLGKLWDMPEGPETTQLHTDKPKTGLYAS